MSIYDITYNTQADRLTPTKKRLPKFLSWLYSVMSAMQWVRDRLLTDYKTGVSYNAWDAISTYFPSDFVIYSNNAVYQCLKTNSATQPDLYPDYWLKTQDCFIGTDERVKYNGQIIVLEYALNRWFQNVGATDQIYINNNVTNADNLLMGNTSVYSGALANNSQYATSYLNNSLIAVQYDYTVNVPSALFTTLGSTTQNRENAIRNIVDKYNMAGMNYNVITF